MVFPIFGGNSKGSGGVRSLRSLGPGGGDFISGGSDETQYVNLEIDIESPPCVLYGAPIESSGALLNGVIRLCVGNPSAASKNRSLDAGSNASSRMVNSLVSTPMSRLTSLSTVKSPASSAKDTLYHLSSTIDKLTVICFSLSLVQKVRYGKPFMPSNPALSSCSNCRSKVIELANWDIVSNPIDVTLGYHTYPFSHLLQGDLPVTCNLGSTGSTHISYELIAVAFYKTLSKGPGSKNTVDRLELKFPIPITRSILRGPDRNSLRVFPPTDVTASAVLPNVVHPRSTIPLELKLHGIYTGDRRWRMRRLTWRVDENVRIRSHACKMHIGTLKAIEDTVREKQARSSKKPAKPIKRTSDMGPQVTVSVSTSANRQINPNMFLPRQDSAAGDMDDDATGTPDGFIHPSDHAMHEELLEQQERVRRQQVEQEQKREVTHYIEETRTLAGDDVKSGWKSDFTGSGKIELVTDIDLTKLNSGVSNPVHSISTLNPYKPPVDQNTNVACDIDDPILGVFVSHLLSVEIIVAEEVLQYPNGQPVSSNLHDSLVAAEGKAFPTNSADQRLAELSPMFANRNMSLQRRESIEEPSLPSRDRSNSGCIDASLRVVGIPTGAARVLRMQFKLHMTERSGLGISWDDEVPPTYQDVKYLSPPGYSATISESREFYNKGHTNNTSEPDTLSSVFPVCSHTSSNSSTRLNNDA
ncbi:Ldb19p Ecym_7357 [Eremothecium cymbalariae DBVPG|uniref:LDB19 N-terminal domain-containing protein n=1 Tax=Eremothecium cymbalariae (strain CBS 270.75 / DBVPG 7215 / KCTC 17166 / NRRL Y-17582) TaxID=931890 RepID=G8JWH0_ERECY|nr:hypothetical protein Ecym_7357 [Eremothecium cymbalariae DBVPG\